MIFTEEASFLVKHIQAFRSSGFFGAARGQGDMNVALLNKLNT
jgi:hypothetical protein